MMVYIILLSVIILALFINILFAVKNRKKFSELIQLQHLFEHTNDYMIFIYRFHPNEKFEYISPSSIYINGYTPEEHYKNPELLKNLVYLDDFPVFEFWKNFPKLSNKPIVMRWVRKDGKIIWTEHRYSSILNKNKISSVVGIIKNITAQKEIEFSLRESEEKYRELFENANDFIFLVDYDKNNLNSSKIIEINQIAEENFYPDNKTSENLILFDIIDPDNLENFKTNITALIKNNTANFETVFINKNGKKINTDINGVFFKFKGKKLFLFIARDITDKKRIEYEIQKNQKLETLAVLSGGIAHDFNNLLTAILGNISLIKFNENNDKTIKNLDDVEKIILKAKNLTLQLLSFSKSDLSNKKTAPITELLQDTASFITTGSKTKCIFEIDKNLELVSFDESQIVLVIDNLILNAMQSMEKGGIIKIKAKNAILQNNKSLPDGKYVSIEIEDQGYGIPEENLEKIFDPFFTTKSKGTGLGLTSTYSIIKRHNGDIKVKSEINKGTTFTILLPASKNKIFTRVNNKEIKIKKGKGKILVMDDNGDIRNVTKRIIEHLGYKVDTAYDGNETIKKFNEAKETNDPFDLLILDLTIQGGMGGKDTIKELIKIDKNVKALVSTGYSTDPVIKDYKIYGFCDIINKPYTVESISNLLYRYISDE